MQKKLTRSELAENEQMGKLNLGTNFMLRRKDWLMEQGKAVAMEEEKEG